MSKEEVKKEILQEQYEQDFQDWKKMLGNNIRY